MIYMRAQGEVWVGANSSGPVAGPGAEGKEHVLTSQARYYNCHSNILIAGVISCE